MKPLDNRPADPLAHHAQLPVRVYESDAVQCDRILRTREVVQRALQDVLANSPFTNLVPLVLSLGCGSGDVEGPFSNMAVNVWGYDCNPDSIAHAKERFPLASYHVANIEALEPPVLPDVLVLTEVLEHLCDPIAFVKRWLPHAQNVVITHPIDEPLFSGESGGEHSWSYSEEDIKQWLVLGGHALEEFFTFDMSGYNIGCIRGKRALDKVLIQD